MSERRTLRIGIVTLGEGWLGGLNYVLNAVEALASLPEEKRPSCSLVVRRQELGMMEAFASILPLVDQILVQGPASASERIRPIASFEDAFAYVDFLYPILATVLSDQDLPAASWIADFQHKRLPGFFSAGEIAARDRDFDLVARKARHVVFSSKTALSDFETFFPRSRAQKHVLRFVSAIKPEWLRLDPAAVAARHGLPKSFFLCCNQFWAHKDHATAFRAMARLRDLGIDLPLACTGSAGDYRHPDYFTNLMRQAEALGLNQRIIVLGELPREEQVALIRASLAMVQPSLFEGWSTVVEDARSLGKAIFLTDIPVHREQRPAHSVFFPPGDANALAEAMAKAAPELMAADRGAWEEAALRAMPARRRRFGFELEAIGRQAAGLV